MDLNVSFMVHNINKAALLYQDIETLAFQYGDEAPLGLSMNAIDFEQTGRRRSTKWFRLQNTTAAIDAWLDNYGDNNNPMYVNGNGKSGKSVAMHFELRGDVVYKDKINWSKHKIPIKVVCDEMDTLFSSNATRQAVSFRSLILCHVYGLWGEVRENLEATIEAVYISLFFSICFYFYAICS
ncbi:hypothetical protein PanWU01x14_153490 [Parasponia andersonii]|uniref:Uncharacterized protein n=1 Tax=Parasponia andersonii TaxID=3476 RepID=A0A2P5CH27_PARAD|nr:hypothetical protein PanWU01x14_153490 [Parasponia andersonii]